MNAFNEHVLDLLKNRVEGSKVAIKKSRFYNHAIVVGVPGSPGGLLISHIRHPEHAYWLIHESLDLDPKDLADGKGVVFNDLIEHKMYTWFDLSKFVEEWSVVVSL